VALPRNEEIDIEEITDEVDGEVIDIAESLAEDEEAAWRADKAVLEARVRSLEASLAKKDCVLAVMEEALQCPVCLEVPRGALVLACTNGHLVCVSCNTAACAVCR
jgi:hypothetical protein